jgi:hypothetical protein
MAATGSN